MVLIFVIFSCIVQQTASQMNDQQWSQDQFKQRKLLQVYNNDPYYNQGSSTGMYGYTSYSYSQPASPPLTLTQISNSQYYQNSDTQNIVAPPKTEPPSTFTSSNNGYSYIQSSSIFAQPLLFITPESAIYPSSLERTAFSASWAPPNPDESGGINVGQMSAVTQVPISTSVIIGSQEPQQQQQPTNIINIPADAYNIEPSTPSSSPPTPTPKSSVYLQCPSQESAVAGCPYDTNTNILTADTLQQQTRSLFKDLLKACTLLEIGLPMFKKSLLFPEQTDCCQRLNKYDSQLLINCNCNSNFKCRQEFNLIGGARGGQTGLENVLEYCGGIGQFQGAPQCN
eukprot:TRINITY_DN4992_c0_g1_i1.p1 TRINITY_DN4992_c0_g1~~TRINITY_DN4992_c0_g1_i1.p1  ORF type:complete len:340 (-),score=18.43 TRINITY_DN4992_c0_g1_i1:3135-4154(-)